MKKPYKLRNVVSIFITLVLLALLLYFLHSVKIDWGGMLVTLRNMSLFYFIAGILCIFVGFFIRVLRFRHVLRFFGSDLSIKHSALFSLMGYFGGSLTPMKVGEPVKVLMMKKMRNVPLTFGFATQLIERLFDFVVLLSFLLFSLFFISFEVKSYLVIIAFSLIVLAYCFFMFGLQTRYIGRFVTRLLRRFKSRLSEKLLEAFVKYSGVSRKKSMSEKLRSSFSWLLFSVLIFAFQAGIWYLFMVAVGYPVSMVVIIFVICVTSFGVFTSTPGGVVAIEGLAVFFFHMFGVPVEVALGVTLLARVFGSYLITLIGALVFFRYRKSIY